MSHHKKWRIRMLSPWHRQRLALAEVCNKTFRLLTSETLVHLVYLFETETFELWWLLWEDATMEKIKTLLIANRGEITVRPKLFKYIFTSEFPDLHLTFITRFGSSKQRRNLASRRYRYTQNPMQPQNMSQMQMKHISYPAHLQRPTQTANRSSNLQRRKA